MKTRGNGKAYNWKFKSKLPREKDSMGNCDRSGYEEDNRPKTRVRRSKKG